MMSFSDQSQNSMLEKEESGTSKSLKRNLERKSANTYSVTETGLPVL